MLNRQRNLVVAGVLIGALLVLLVYIGHLFNFTGGAKLEARQKTTEIMNGLAVGDSKERIAGFLDSKLPFDFKLSKLSDQWIISTPLEIGATGWVLHLRFRDEGMTSAFIRVQDGNYRPRDAPPDKGDAPKPDGVF